jgi:predicted nucleotidyltransferase
LKTSPEELKSRVTTEAATLLYYGAEKEYKQAKLKAAKTFGVHFLPSNREIALELDRITEENEGAARKEQLTQMRRDALNIMIILKAYCPLLIGSVWRGTTRKGSDIDVAIYHDSPEEIPKILAANGFKAYKTEWTTVTKHGKTETSLHIYSVTLGKHAVEIVVRSSEEANRKRKCEIFGDEIKGLNIQELTKVLAENPTRKFLPS